MNTETKMKRLKDVSTEICLSRYGEPTITTFRIVKRAARMLDDDRFVDSQCGGNRQAACEAIEAMLFPLGAIYPVESLVAMIQVFPNESDWQKHDDDIQWLYAEIFEYFPNESDWSSRNYSLLNLRDETLCAEKTERRREQNTQYRG